MKQSFPPDEATITVTPKEIEAAFTEWDRRYREDPESFENEAVRLLKGTPETYGEACTPYFIAILSGWKKTTDVTAPPSVQQ